MSLLPGDGLVQLRGLRIAALCLPAAEVGGDYYDLLPLSETRMGCWSPTCRARAPRRPCTWPS